MCVCLETWSSVLFTFPGDYSKWSLDSSCEKKKIRWQNSNINHTGGIRGVTKVKAVRRLRELLITKLPHGTFPVKVFWNTVLNSSFLWYCYSNIFSHMFCPHFFYFGEFFGHLLSVLW